LLTTANLAGLGTFELHSPTRRNGMTITICLADQQDKVDTPVKFVPVQLLQQRKPEIHNMSARRAYELFECRGRVPSHEIDDWVQAESELIYPCCHRLKEFAEAIVLHVDLPGSLTADQLTVSVKPRRLLVVRRKSVCCMETRAILIGRCDRSRSSECRRMWTRPKQRRH